MPVNDYAAVVEALAAGKLDMAWLGGFTYVQAHRRADKVVPLVQRQEDAQFTSKFIANADSGIKTLADTRARTSRSAPLLHLRSPDATPLPGRAGHQPGT